MVSLEHAIAAPFCTRQLADLGARVIKIERPGAGDFARGYDERVDGLASHFVWTNRSKESLSLDVKQDAAAQVLDQLWPRPTCWCRTWHRRRRAHGALLRGAARTLSAADRLRHFRLRRGWPYEQKKAYDLLIQSEAAFSPSPGPDETEMAKAGCSIADIAAGMYAYTGVLGADAARQDGRGQPRRRFHARKPGGVDGLPVVLRLQGRDAAAACRRRPRHYLPYGPFPTGDGGTVMLGLQNEREWLAFCDKVLLQPELAQDERFSSNARRSEHRTELRALIVEAFSHLSAEEVIARLDAAPIANAHVNDMAGVWAHPQLEARQRWSEVDSPAGRLPALLPPGRNSAFAPRMDPIPPWASTPTACWPSWVTPPATFSACTSRARYERAQEPAHELIDHP